LYKILVYNLRMFKFFIFIIIFSGLAQAESISLKDLVREQPVAVPKSVNDESKNQDQTNIQVINQYFKSIEQKYPQLGTFQYLEDRILMSKINANTDKVSDKITKFRPFTLFKMEKMEQIFKEVDLYLEEKYGKEKQKDTLGAEVEQQNPGF
jgi:hypothetical protein